MFDCTPGFPEQLHDLDRLAAGKGRPGLDGIFLTHAHIGHYAGLIHLGREVMGARKAPVYCLPRMAKFLRGNGPWSQLVEANHIELRHLEAGKSVRLNDRLQVTALLVPHRSEYSETVGFRIQGPKRAVLYLPDIDRWEDWATRIEDALKGVDRAYLDGTFYDETELPGRDLKKIPHPFITTSLRRFGPLPAAERGKVHFLHLNHTNPALDPGSAAARAIRRAGCRVAEQGSRFEL
jgi:pyrroloquinoline quinone biosynthesis protein B